MGMTRRLQHVSDLKWRPLLIIALIGTFIIAVGVIMQILQFIISIKDRKKNLDTTGDPWDGRGLEWSTKSPPPVYNFAILPIVFGRHPFWDSKYGIQEKSVPVYTDIHMPKNTGIGFFIAGMSFLLGFGIVWHIVWIVVLALLLIITALIIRSCDEDTEYHIPKEEVIRLEGLPMN
jgi:cytochrome o ubiquinol oxidase subunit 1